jgi:hypothetical protein
MVLRGKLGRSTIQAGIESEGMVTLNSRDTSELSMDSMRSRRVGQYRTYRLFPDHNS